MKQYLTKLLCCIAVCICCISNKTNAQTFENAGDYLSYINNKSSTLTATYLAYLSAMSHGKSARKVEKRRNEVIAAIVNTRSDIAGMPAWKADRSLKDTTVSYLKILYSVFNEDYNKIVNMEEIAEQSYDGREAYMLAQEKAYEKLNDVGKRQQEMQKVFAKKYNINLIESESDTEAKSKIVHEVMEHCNAAYLIFFKCYKQEAYLMAAIDKKNLVGIEQSLSSLAKFADEGKTKLRSLKGYQGDGSLIEACKNMMNYYEAEAKKGPAISEFFLKEEAFTKAKKLFEATPASKRTQQDVDTYNKAVNAMNNAANGFNASMGDINKQGTTALNNWNKAYSNYMDEHMPKQSKQ